ncbi:DUF3267 domain-containing protein [Pseudoduganella sp. OTU4001]|uniref:DUF3267 domain-containing protein n=1 Tax=Pseudoduganella sp. OTU4001 TaxID=3043854 RepID=UPI00313B7CCB
MRLFRIAAIRQPDAVDSWRAAPIGFSLTEIRILSYASIALFFGVNALGLLIWGSAYFEGFASFAKGQSIALTTAYVIAALLAYHVMHELIHIALHPDRGLSDRTMIGVKAAAFFVIYNGEISKENLLRVVIAPFAVLTPLCALAALAPFSPIFLANMFGLHLSACAGDLLLYRKLKNGPEFAWMWNAYTSAYIK